MTLKEKIIDLVQSPLFSWIITRILWILGIGFVLGFTFIAGEAIGYHKAGFSYRGGESYTRIFGGPHPSPFNTPVMDNSLANPHGAFGKVVKVALPEIVISATDGTEKTIYVEASSTIRRFRDDVSSTTLAVGDTVIVIGDPDDQGRTVARLVRIIPAQ